MPTVKLIHPTLKHQQDVEAFIEECNTHKSPFYGTSRVNEMPYKAWLEKVLIYAKGKNLEPDKVPASTFLIYDGEWLVGFINIRHHLNPFLLEAGGHIGYMIRPLMREKGYAKAALNEALKYCKTHLKLDKVLVTCDPSNEGSKRTILANKGQYENTVQSEMLGTVNRYWIDLQEIKD